jgi:hypothetical protein
MAVENLPAGNTTTYSVEICHSRNEGIVASAVAGPVPQNASLVRLHAPVEMISVYWTAVSEGKPPTLPSSKSFLANYNRVLLAGERVGMVFPSLVGHTWMAAGVFHYCVVGPEGLDSNLGLSHCPWEKAPTTDFYIPSANFQGTILNTNATLPKGLTLDPDVVLLNQELAKYG